MKINEILSEAPRLDPSSIQARTQRSARAQNQQAQQAQAQQDLQQGPEYTEPSGAQQVGDTFRNIGGKVAQGINAVTQAWQAGSKAGQQAATYSPPGQRTVQPQQQQQQPTPQAAEPQQEPGAQQAAPASPPAATNYNIPSYQRRDKTVSTTQPEYHPSAVDPIDPSLLGINQLQIQGHGILTKGTDGKWRDEQEDVIVRPGDIAELERRLLQKQQTKQMAPAQPAYVRGQRRQTRVR